LSFVCFLAFEKAQQKKKTKKNNQIDFSQRVGLNTEKKKKKTFTVFAFCFLCNEMVVVCCIHFQEKKNVTSCGFFQLEKSEQKSRSLNQTKIAFYHHKN